MAAKDQSRPNPDELLRRVQAEEARESRGRLKIFLGYAPRVGKSSRMFDEGRRRRLRGQDVVVGALQMRGLPEGVAAEFEVLGASGQLDVEAILRRGPEVCLIDELARGERWRDVQTIQSHGINVIGALNLQHICEQQDAVEKITGSRAPDCVPAGFIASADELVVVDIPETELPGRNADQLSQLRELALLLAAQVVEDQLRRYMDSQGILENWGTQERILVCITPRSSARAMLDSAARAATRFHGQFFALYVRQPDLSREADELVRANLDYARKLGAEVFEAEGSDPIREILTSAREKRVTQLFVGHTRQPAWKFWASSPVERLIRGAEGMDVRLFPNA